MNRECIRPHTIIDLSHYSATDDLLGENEAGGAFQYNEFKITIEAFNNHSTSFTNTERI